MNWEIILASVIAVVGWGVVHKFSELRDIKNKRREKRTEYLIQAYTLISSAARRDSDEGQVAKIESAVEIIQLFGTKSQCQLIEVFVQRIISPGKKWVPMDSILSDLRDDLRNELDLGESIENLWWLRMQDGVWQGGKAE